MIRSPHLCVAIFATSFLTLSTFAQHVGLTAVQIQKISDLAATTVDKNHLPGIQVSVAKNGQIWNAGFGKADLEQDVPVTSQSVFRTASIAKWFTAAATMKLVEDGKLELDAPIQQYCPQFPSKPWPITTRELLIHTSGIRDYYGDNGEKPATDADRRALEQLIAHEESEQYTRYTEVISPLNAFKTDPLLFQPGTRVQYSSLGYRVLGCVLEGAADRPYRMLMRELVFVPAGMTSTTEDDAPAIVPHRAQGYSRGPNDTTVRAPFRDVSENLPAGGYLSTTEDLIRFALAFSSGRLVMAQTRDKMLEHPKLADGTLAPNPFGNPKYFYGMGIMVDPGEEQPAWFHTGGQSGTSALLFYFPKTETAVAIMTNMDHSAIRESLARKISEIAREN
jgi:serine beta-lactamase-like protein LACTB, mitochondrial